MNLALFDLDYTLLNGDSDHAWGSFLVDEGIRDREEFGRRNDEFWAQYKVGTLDIMAYLRFALEPFAGQSVASVKPLLDRYLATKITPMMSAAAHELIARHAGDHCAIVTATNQIVTEPIAQAFGVDHLIACEVEVIGGKYTGEPSGLPSFREGKITRVEQWLSSRDLSIDSFEQSFFYSDSLNDLPLLERVTNPVAVNPDPTLRAHAQARGWPILSIC